MDWKTHPPLSISAPELLQSSIVLGEQMMTMVMTVMMTVMMVMMMMTVMIVIESSIQLSGGSISLSLNSNFVPEEKITFSLLL